MEAPLDSDVYVVRNIVLSTIIFLRMNVQCLSSILLVHYYFNSFDLKMYAHLFVASHFA
jgi:hypothetical protein